MIFNIDDFMNKKDYEWIYFKTLKEYDKFVSYLKHEYHYSGEDFVFESLKSHDSDYYFIHYNDWDYPLGFFETGIDSCASIGSNDISFDELVFDGKFSATEESLIEFLEGRHD